MTACCGSDTFQTKATKTKQKKSAPINLVPHFIFQCLFYRLTICKLKLNFLYLRVGLSNLSALFLKRSEPATHHFPLLPIPFQQGGRRGGRGGSRGGSGGGRGERFWSGTYCSTLTPQGGILVSLLVVAHMLQAWKFQEDNYKSRYNEFLMYCTIKKVL